MKINLTPGANIKPLRTTSVTAQEQLEGAEAVRDTFRQFVGETFFKQMLKSMRSTQDKPAYFHGAMRKRSSKANSTRFWQRK